MAVDPGRLLQMAVQLLTAALYLWVGRIVLDRQLRGDARSANRLFAVWWISLGALYVTLPGYTLLYRFLGSQDLALAVTYINAILLLIVLAAWGLINYLLYLYTGKTTWWVASSVFYGALALAFLYLIAWLDPIGFSATGSIVYARESPLGPSIAIGLAFSVPILLAALAYGSLLFRVQDPLPRYRIALVAGGFLLQFGWSATSSALQLSRKYPDSIGLALFGNAIAILAAVAILLAFRPPPAVRRRLDAATLGGS